MTWSDVEAALRANGGREGGSLRDGRVSRQLASFVSVCNDNWKDARLPWEAFRFAAACTATE